MDSSPVVQMFPLSVEESPIHCVKQCFVTVLNASAGERRLYTSWSTRFPGKRSHLLQEVVRAYEQRTPIHQPPDETRKGGRTGPQQKGGAPYLNRRRRFIVKTFASAGSTVIGLLTLWRYCSNASLAPIVGAFTAATRLVPYG